MWSIDRFNARKGNQLLDARLSLTTTTHSTAENKNLLEIINQDKLQSATMISTAIVSSLIAYGNAMGLVYHEYKTPESCQVVTICNLRYACRQLGVTERLAALHFLTGLTLDVLHAQV